MRRPDVAPHVPARGGADAVDEHAEELAPRLGELVAEAGHEPPLVAEGAGHQDRRVAPVGHGEPVPRDDRWGHVDEHEAVAVDPVETLRAE